MEELLFEGYEQALCASYSADFFPLETDDAEAGLAICQACPVQAPCLAYALEHEEFGTWGGSTEWERWELREARQIVVTDEHFLHGTQAATNDHRRSGRNGGKPCALCRRMARVRQRDGA